MHRLRPGDIDVVAGLGDSLVAGSGAMEEFAVGTFIEARGVSWCTGGQGNWRKFLTLPNILKVRVSRSVLLQGLLLSLVSRRIFVKLCAVRSEKNYARMYICVYARFNFYIAE